MTPTFPRAAPAGLFPGVLASLLAITLLAGCGGDDTYRAKNFEAGPMLGLTKALSDDALEGRKPNTPGSIKAQTLITERMSRIGLTPVGGDSFAHPFTYGPFEIGSTAPKDKPGTNLIGAIQGTSDSDLILVITAHYDHLGIRDGEIYNGADDNAAGIAAMLAVGEYFRVNPPLHTVILIAFDAEEDGFGGARHFIESPPFPLERIGFALNLDMISRGDKGTLWASGSHHRPYLLTMIETVAAVAPIPFKPGFDGANGQQDDWTNMSDHWVFHAKAIPYLYLGVEDHADYHQPTDDFDRIEQGFFLASVDTIILMAAEADKGLDAIAAQAQASRAVAATP
jgi:hypothetical protein